MFAFSKISKKRLVSEKQGLVRYLQETPPKHCLRRCGVSYAAFIKKKSTPLNIFAYGITKKSHNQQLTDKKVLSRGKIQMRLLWFCPIKIRILKIKK